MDGDEALPLVSMDEDEVELILSNLHARYYELRDSVSAVLSAAVGDMTRTRLQIHAVVIFRNAFEYVRRNPFSLGLILTNVNAESTSRATDG